jgi:hypothetical protein
MATGTGPQCPQTDEDIEVGNASETVSPQRTSEDQMEVNDEIVKKESRDVSENGAQVQAMQQGESGAEEEPIGPAYSPQLSINTILASTELGGENGNVGGGKTMATPSQPLQTIHEPKAGETGEHNLPPPPLETPLKSNLSSARERSQGNESEPAQGCDNSSGDTDDGSRGLRREVSFRSEAEVDMVDPFLMLVDSSIHSGGGHDSITSLATLGSSDFEAKPGTDDNPRCSIKVLPKDNSRMSLVVDLETGKEGGVRGHRALVRYSL